MTSNYEIKDCPVCNQTLIINYLGVQNKFCPNEDYAIFKGSHNGYSFEEEKTKLGSCFLSYFPIADKTYFHSAVGRSMINTMETNHVFGSRPGNHLFDPEFHIFVKNFMLLK